MSERDLQPRFAVLAGAWRSARSLTITFAVTTLMVPLLSLPGGHSASAQDSLQYATLNPTQDLSDVYGGLAEPLLKADAERYREIFRTQQQGQWQTADRLIAALENDVLMGHVLSQRYLHPTAYRSSFKELKRWLDLYPDHPKASRIYRLAKKRQPAGAVDPRKPISGYLAGSGQEIDPKQKISYLSDKKRSSSQKRAIKRWQSSVRRLVERDRPTQARKLLRDDRMRAMLTQYEYDMALWTIAKGYFANKKDELAYQFASTAAARSGIREPRINWTAGLAAFRAGLYDKAASHFVRLVGTRAILGEDRAGAAFWAARSYLLSGQPRDVGRYLNIASEASDGFYGIMAQALLGQPIAFDWHATGLRNDTLDILNRFPGSRRAMALGQVGQFDRAEAEIRKLAARARPPLAQALVALARELDLPATQMRVAQSLRLMDGRRHDGAMFPIPRWSQRDDLKGDPALLLAITRAESAFDKKAVSGAGARGLMQILPSTARDMSKRFGIRYDGKYHLHDPETNIRFGSAYIAWLQSTDLIGDSLIPLLMAYNAGPKRVKRWKDEFEGIQDDPILFLESVPIPETRNYVKKVMANLWAYRAQMSLEMPTLINLAENSWPRVSDLEASSADLARLD